MPKTAKEETQPNIENLHTNLLYCREDANCLGLEIEAHLIDAAIEGVEERLKRQAQVEKAQAAAA